MSLAHSDEIAAAIRTRHLQTPIGRATTYPTDQRADHAAAELESFGFHFAPVRGKDGQLAGYVERESLRHRDGTIAACVEPITAARLVAGDTPITRLLPALLEKRFLFVVDHDGISGLVTRSDLNKQPARTYFYMLIAALEMLLAEIIRETYPDETETLALLTVARRTRVADRLDATLDDGSAGAVAAMELTDLLRIANKDAWLRKRFGDLSATQWNSRVMKPIINLRNDIMHAVRTLSTDTRESVQKLVDGDLLLRRLLTALEPEEPRTRADLPAGLPATVPSQRAANDTADSPSTPRTGQPFS